MNTLMAKIKRFGKIRQFYTITHKETIKPSFPTPPHLKLHNLSMLDLINPNVHVPLVFFYKNYKSCDTNILKKALSKSLTQYYPFAGRYLAPSAPHINCNDEGVEFLEASIDIPFHDFILKRDPDETILNKLIPNGLGCAFNRNSTNMLQVQLNHFSCGGAALAVSLSHKVGDGFTMGNFLNHWAAVTHGGSPINPTFISATKKDTSNLLDYSATLVKDKFVERRFVFPNSKLSELKKKINAMGIIPLNPTRVEALSSLLFKCAVDAATTKNGFLQLSNLGLIVNMREKVTTICTPKAAAGNIVTAAIAKMADNSGEIQLNEVITSLRKDRSEIQKVKYVEELDEMLLKKIAVLAQDLSRRTYMCSSVCRFPFYQVDFGWGKPERVILVTTGNVGTSQIIFMDTASGNGIEAIVHLEEEEMTLLQNHKELLLYVEDNY